MIAFTLEIAPVAKERPRFARRGRKVVTYTPAKTLRFEREAADLARKEFKRKPIAGPVVLTARFILTPPKRKRFSVPAVRPDLDNYAKALTDALNGVVWADDGLIHEAHFSKVYDLTGAGPRIEIEVVETGATECSAPKEFF